MYLNNCVIFLMILFYSCDSSQKRQEVKENTENVMMISLGMNKGKVFEIMGEPDGITKFGRHCTNYFYQPPLGAEKGIDILLDSLDKVVVVTYHDGPDLGFYICLE